MSKNTQTPKPLRNEAVNAADVAPYKTDTIKDTLKHEENAITLAVEIDAIIGTLIDLLGCEVESVGLSTGMISNHLFQLRRWKFIAETQDKTLQEYRLVFQEYKQYFEENKEIIKELHHYYLSHLPIKPQPLNRCKIVKMY